MPEVRQLVENMIARHADTRIINLYRPLAAASCFRNNESAIVNFIVDLLSTRIQAGKTTALLMRTDHPGEAPDRQFLTRGIASLSAELHLRGLQDIEFRRPGSDLPEVPHPRCVPIVTYGMAGLGHYEHYQALIAMHAYHVDPRAISDQAFDFQAPSLRPALAIAKGDVRRLDWKHLAATDRDVRRRAEAMFVRLEIDPTLQAAARVRFTIRPRLVILNARFRLEPYVGKVELAQNLTHARFLLGLPSDTRVVRQRQQADALGRLIGEGHTLTSAADVLGISRRSATSIRAVFGRDWLLPMGRPLDSG
jgi:hypothetical protein